MPPLTLTLSTLSTVFAMTMPCLADTLSLYNWGFNVDGALIDKANTPGSLPPAIGVGGFNFPEGLGTITIAVAGVGAHTVDIYFDHDLNPAQFGSDYSAAVGTPSTGESWEIGTGSEEGGTQLFTAFTTNSYDNTDHSPQPDDVAVGLAFSFVTTAADPLGVVTISVGTSAPSPGFYLEQWNDYSGTTPSEIYISGSEVNTPAPEPATGLLFILPLGIFFWRRRPLHNSRPDISTVVRSNMTTVVL